MSIDISELRKLPVAEKLRIIEALWDDIAASKEPIEMPSVSGLQRSPNSRNRMRAFIKGFERQRSIDSPMSCCSNFATSSS